MDILSSKDYETLGREFASKNIDILDKCIQEMENSINYHNEMFNQLSGISLNFFYLFEPIIPLLVLFREDKILQIKEGQTHLEKDINLYSTFKRIVKGFNKEEYTASYEKFIKYNGDLIIPLSKPMTTFEFVRNQFPYEFYIIPTLILETINEDYEKAIEIIDILYNISNSCDVILGFVCVSIDVLNNLSSPIYNQCELTLNLSKLLQYTILKYTKKLLTKEDKDILIKEKLVLKLQYDSEQNKKLDKIYEQNEKFKNLGSDLQYLVKQEINNTLSKSLKEIENIKYNTMEASYKKSIETLVDKTNQMQIHIQEKSSTIREQKKIISDLEYKIKELEKKCFELENNYINDTSIDDGLELDNNLIEENIGIKNNQLGILIFKDDKYYFKNKYENEIEVDIVCESLLGNNLFVQIDKDNNLIRTYSYFDNLQQPLKEDEYYALVEITNNEFYGFIPDLNKRIPLKLDKYQVRLNQVIKINEYGNILSFYKYAKFNIDTYKEYITREYKNVYFILNKFGNNYILRNVFNNEEILKVIEEEVGIFNEHTVLLEKNDMEFKNIQSSLFYTSSSVYDKSKLLIVKINNDDVYGEDENKKLFYINNLPINKTIYEGDIIKVDENYSFIEFYEHKVDYTPNRKKINIKNTNKEKLNPDIINHNVLVLGNVKYRNNYKIAGLKNGINIDLLDGFTSFNRIKLDVKSYDLIVVMPSFCSHDNMWQVKENYSNSIFPDSDGANRLVEYILEYFDDKQI